MAFILSIETATTVCSVALHENGKLMASKSLHLAQSHSGLLIVLIEQIMQQCNVSVMQLDAVGISEGPGSYTGLRIGTSTAKGICFAADVPLIAINTLEAMAKHMQAYNVQQYHLFPMLDARRMEVYGLLCDHELKEVEAAQPFIVDESSFDAWLSEHPTIFFGNGARKCIEVLPHQSNVYFVDNIHPDAAAIGQLALDKFERKAFEDTAYFEPFYLKDYRAGKPKSILKHVTTGKHH